MKPKYMISKPLVGFEKNTEYAQQLMSTFEMSGVFSDVLLNRVRDILEVTIYAMERNIDKVPFEKYTEFVGILDTYCIFSEEFKKSCSTLFTSTITHYPKY